MWRDDFDAPRARPAGTLHRRRAGRRGRRPGLLPGLAHVVAVVLVRTSPACASPARATCWRSSSSCAGGWPPRGCSSRRRPAPTASPAHDRRRHRRGRQGPRRRPRRPAPPRLGAAASSGRSPRCRTATRPRASAARSGARRRRGRRGRHRGARRRVAGRPLLLLRRDPVPDGRAPARPRHRLGRPPHRPHAARRRRGRRAARRRRTPPRRPCRCTAELPPGAGDPGPRPGGSPATGAAPSSRAHGCSRGSPRAPAEHVARHRRALHQHLRELRASAARARAEAERTRTQRRALVLSPRPPPRPARDAAARRTGLESLALALAAHDPARVVERGYAVVDDRAGGVVTSAPRPPVRPAACACASPTPSSTPPSRRTRRERRTDHRRPAILRGRDGAPGGDHPPPGLRRGRPARDPRPRQARAAASSSSARPSSTPSAAASRSCASTSSSRASRAARRREPVGAPRRAAAGDRGLRPGAAAARRLERLHAPEHGHPPARRRAGRASART